MKNRFLAVMVFAALLFSFDPAFAATKNQANLTTAQIDQLNQLGAPSSILSTRQTNLGTALNDVITAAMGNGATGDSTSLIAEGRVGGLVWTLPSSSTGGTITSIPYTMILKAIGGNGVDNSPGMSLIDGLPNQDLTIQITGLASSGTFLVTPVHSTGFVSITFDTRGDTATLHFDSVLGWIVTSNGGALINQNT